VADFIKRTMDEALEVRERLNRLLGPVG
jgi:hypothetical protein